MFPGSREGSKEREKVRARGRERRSFFPRGVDRRVLNYVGHILRFAAKTRSRLIDFLSEKMILIYTSGTRGTCLQSIPIPVRSSREEYNSAPICKSGRHGALHCSLLLLEYVRICPRTASTYRVYLYAQPAYQPTLSREKTRLCLSSSRIGPRGAPETTSCYENENTSGELLAQTTQGPFCVRIKYD